MHEYKIIYHTAWANYRSGPILAVVHGLTPVDAKMTLLDSSVFKCMDHRMIVVDSIELVK